MIVDTKLPSGSLDRGTGRQETLDPHALGMITALQVKIRPALGFFTTTLDQSHRSQAQQGRPLVALVEVLRPFMPSRLASHPDGPARSGCSGISTRAACCSWADSHRLSAHATARCDPA